MGFENITKAFFLGVACLAAGLSGCGVSGTTNLTAEITAPSNCGVANSASLTYLFFSSLDATCPGKPAVVDAGTDVQSNIFNPAWIFPTGSYNASTQTVTGIQNHVMVYAKTDGKFYKVSALKGSGLPASTAFSSVNSDKVCAAVLSAFDFATPDNSQIVYRSAGANNACYDSDDVYKMVRLSMAITDAPVLAKEPLLFSTAFHDWATGAISGWLVNDAGALKHCDANFGNCSASLTTIKNYASVVWIAGSNRWLLDLDHVIYAYNGDTKTLSSALHTINSSSDGISHFVTYRTGDGNNFYFTTSKAPQAIYSVPIDGSAQASQINLPSDTDSIAGLTLSTNTLVYWTNTAIKTMAKSGGSATALLTRTSPVVVAVRDNHIYYHTGGATPSAGVIDDDVVPNTETANAKWVGFIQGTTWNLSDGFAAIYQTQSIIRADGYTSSKGSAGASLRSVNTTTTAELVLGTVPADIVSLYCSSFGANALCNGLNTSTQNDIFFLNADSAGSFLRITDTPDKNEFPL